MPVGTGGGVNSIEESGQKSFAGIKRPRLSPVELSYRHLRSQGQKGECEQCSLPLTEPHSKEQTNSLDSLTS